MGNYRSNKVYGILFLLLCTITLKAQHYNVWSFATNKFLDFKTEPPTLSIRPNSFNFLLGYPNATLCDSLGNLICYLHGGPYMYLIDKNDNPLPYSKITWNWPSNIGGYMNNFFITKGNSTSSCYLVNSFPGIDCFGNSVKDSFLFSFDQHLNNGLGGFIDTIPQKTPGINTLSHLTFCRQTNNTDYWVVGKCFDTLCVISASQNGLTLVHKKLEVEVNNANYLNQNTWISGRMKFSNKATKLACMSQYNGLYSIRQFDTTVITIYDFDISTGLLTNKKIIYKHNSNYPDSWKFVDLCFSPNDSFLYITWNRPFLSSDPSNIMVRYDMNHFKFDTIPIPNLGCVTNIQTGPNNKMYFLSWSDADISNKELSRLSSIFYPNNPNASEVKISSQVLDTSINADLFACLPHHDQYVFTQFTFKMLSNCVTQFINQSPSGFNNFKWYFGDGDSSDQFEPTHSYAHHGMYYVKMAAFKENGFIVWYSDSILIPSILHANIGNKDSIGCAWIAVQFNDSSFLDTFSNNSKTIKWQWDFGDQTYDTVQHPKHVYVQSGKYTVKLKVSSDNCNDTVFMKKDIFILPSPKPGFTLNKNKFCAPPAAHIIITDTVQTYVSSKTYQFSADENAHPFPIIDHVFWYDYNYPDRQRIIQHLTSPSGCEAWDTQYVDIYNSLDGFKPLAPTVTIENSFPLIYWNKNPDAVYYSVSKGMNGRVPQFLFNTTDTLFFDSNNVNTSHHSYQYAIQMKDYCDEMSLQSDKETSILLTGKSNLNRSADLSWNDITNSSHLFNLMKPEGSLQLTIPSSGVFYRDANFYVDSLYGINYRIETANSLSSLVKSNELFLPYNPYVFIPSYGDINLYPFGIPINTYLIDHFQIEFFNLLGQSVYKDNNVSTFYYSNQVTQYYIYQVTGTDVFGKPYHQIGKILLIY